MSDEEVRKFLQETKTIILCSIGKDGFPHPMPMWFGLEDDGTVVMTTFAKSQKVQNLKRDPRVTLLAEAGEVYAELRGVMLRGKAEIVSDVERVLDVLEKVSARSGAAPQAGSEALRAGLLATARKRCLIRVKPDTVVSFDHRKLGGVY
jgi:PPOX class probable F420-dependent enzyme